MCVRSKKPRAVISSYLPGHPGALGCDFLRARGAREGRLVGQWSWEILDVWYPRFFFPLECLLYNVLVRVFLALFRKFLVQWKTLLVGGLAFDSTGESCYLTRVATGKFISFP